MCSSTGKTTKRRTVPQKLVTQHQLALQTRRLLRLPLPRRTPTKATKSNSQPTMRKPLYQMERPLFATSLGKIIPTPTRRCARVWKYTRSTCGSTDNGSGTHRTLRRFTPLICPASWSPLEESSQHKSPVSPLPNRYAFDTEDTIQSEVEGHQRSLESASRGTGGVYGRGMVDWHGDGDR